MTERIDYQYNAQERIKVALDRVKSNAIRVAAEALVDTGFTHAVAVSNWLDDYADRIEKGESNE